MWMRFKQCRYRFLFILLLTCSFTPLFAGEVLIKKIRIIGNSRLPEAVLRKVIALQEGRSYDFSRIRNSVRELLRLYRQKGYVYAAVAQANIRLDGTLVLQVHEGKIRFIRILNKNIYTIYRFRRALKIKDGQVFNKHLLDAEMERLKKKFHLKELRYISRPTEGAPHLRNIFIDARGYKSRSFSYSFDAEAFYVIPKFGYHNYDFWGLDHEISLYARSKMEWRRIYDHVFGLSYYMPSIFGKIFRPYINSEFSLFNESRKDMNIAYSWNSLKVGVFIENRLTEYINLRVGAVETLYSVEDIEAIDGGRSINSVAIASRGQKHAHLLLSFNLVDPENRFNRDKAFRLYVEGLCYLNKDYEVFYSLRVDCRKTFERDDDDFILSFKHRFFSKKADYFYDIDATSLSMRGYDGDTYFTRHLISLTAEYKLSLWKEHVKLLFFADTVLLRPLAYSGQLQQEAFSFKGSFGEGIEINYSEFSLRFYYGVPYQNRLTDGRVKVQLKKVF